MPLGHWKTVSMWIFGAISIFLGSMIAGKLYFGPDVTEIGFILAAVVSIMLILIGGLLWISVALAVRFSKR